ncbi:MAG: polysaccharide lyase [Candidatus Dormibacteria bacterium]
MAVAPGLLTVIYPAGSTAPSMGPPHGGAQVCEPFSSGPRTSATLSYQVRFPVGFQFVKGGKLPGLYGGVEPFSGGRHNSAGWSTRLMWRAGGAGEIYAYIAGVNGYGLDLGRGDFTWPADGQWHTVTLHVVVNTPGHSDGEAVLSLDGRVVVDATNLDISDSGVPIGGLFFSTFYGGHDPSWAPSSEMNTQFRDFSAS